MFVLNARIPMVLDQFAHIARTQDQAISDLYKWMFVRKPSNNMVTNYKKGGRGSTKGEGGWASEVLPL